jgi:hypothetical protein
VKENAFRESGTTSQHVQMTMGHWPTSMQARKQQSCMQVPNTNWKTRRGDQEGKGGGGGGRGEGEREGGRRAREGGGGGGEV